MIFKKGDIVKLAGSLFKVIKGPEVNRFSGRNYYDIESYPKILGSTYRNCLDSAVLVESLTKHHPHTKIFQ